MEAKESVRNVIKHAPSVTRLRAARNAWRITIFSMVSAILAAQSAHTPMGGTV